MAEAEESKEEFYLRLLTFVIGPATEVLQLFFEIKVLNSLDFFIFLENNKHVLFHELHPSIPCCECKQVSLATPRKKCRLNEDQFDTLFETDEVQGVEDHKRHERRQIKQLCLCSVSAKRTASVDLMDITLLSSVIKSCCQPGSIAGNPNWIKDIKKTRNFIAHSPRMKITKSVFEQKFALVEQSVLNLASVVGPVFVKMIKDQISIFKNSDLSAIIDKDLKKNNNDRIHQILEMFVEKQTSTLESFENQTRNLVENAQEIKTEVLSRLQEQQEDLFVGLRNVVFEVKTLWKDELSKATDPNKKELLHDDDCCYVEWTLGTPGNWDVDEIKETLENFSSLMGKFFRIVFVYKGSIIIQTSAPLRFVNNKDEFQMAVKSFLKDFLDICELDTETNTIVQVTIMISMEKFESIGSKRRHPSFRHEEDALYASIDPKQDIPMRGIPQPFLQMKKQTISRSDHLYNAYTNLKIEERRSQTTQIQIQISELTAPDRPRVDIENDRIHVREPVTTALIDRIRSHLESDTFSNVLKMKNCPTWTKTDGQSDTYLLDYSMDCRTSVMELANSRHFGDPSIDSVKKKNIDLVLKMVKFVMEMNRCSWILGSLRLADMYLSNDNDQVVMARLGRMLWFGRSGLEDDYVIASQDCTDNMRWCPIEVLQFKQYSFASDVYSLAMTIYEFFMTLSVNQKDPMAGELESAPFPNVALEDLRDNLFRDGKPDQPEACPEWLYEHMCRCWSKDKDKRPTCVELYTIIEKHLRLEENVSEQDQYDKITEQTDNSDQYDDILDNGATHMDCLRDSEMEGDYESIPFDCVNSDSDSEDNEIVLRKQQQRKLKQNK